MNNRPPAIRQRFKRESRAGQRLMLSSISLFELWFGIANSSHKSANEQQLAGFCTAVEVLPFDDNDARSAAFIRADLANVGKPIGGYDLLIAGQALRRGL